jgi:hypothetical protein
MELDNKLVAILNKGLDTDVAFNALSHMTLSLGERMGSSSSDDEIIYYGIVLFGPKELVGELTKKFSLWR